MSIIAAVGDEVGYLNGLVVGLFIVGAVVIPSMPKQRLVSPAKFESQHSRNVSNMKSPGLVFK